MSVRGGSLSAEEDGPQLGQKNDLSKKESPEKAEARGCKQQKAHWTLISAVAKPDATQAGPTAHHTESKASSL